MYTCPVCSKEFDTSRSYGGHYSSHFRTDKYKTGRLKNIKNIDHECKYCHLFFDSGMMLGGHIRTCEKRPDYKQQIDFVRHITQRTKGLIKPDKVCDKCGKPGVLYHGRYCCECKEKYYKFYLAECQFQFNVFDYPDYFDLDMIKRHGMYTASNRGSNSNGVVRDHIYSISDGYRNNVDSSLLRHPANCQLILHKENVKKNSKSHIILEELKIRIGLFDERYGGIAQR